MKRKRISWTNLAAVVAVFLAITLIVVKNVEANTRQFTLAPYPGD